ncbi:response regulator transcription factor [Geomonas sp. Red32]|uniref:response regulator transcription factor n=1 Tax=Geomonas sp. Red32 TaxID=2912856 RepID=UPI00202CF7EE|nr:response regulator transcription factor [Geomonas sp. Red32]MCM0081323.1 response regulator transcription factor [Geomonas sp. Red32]
MSHFISERLTTPCSIVSTLDEISRSEDKQRLVLHEYREWHNTLSTAPDEILQECLAKNLVVLVNVPTNRGIETDALCQGVRGFVYERDSSDVLLKMIQAVFAAELWVSRNVMTEFIQRSSRKFRPEPVLTHSQGPAPLTSREMEILNGISSGRSNERIADDLCISLHTVKTHVYHIFKKINVTSRLQAANWSSRYL